MLKFSKRVFATIVAILVTFTSTPLTSFHVDNTLVVCALSESDFSEDEWKKMDKMTDSELRIYLATVKGYKTGIEDAIKSIRAILKSMNGGLNYSLTAFYGLTESQIVTKLVNDYKRTPGSSTNNEAKTVYNNIRRKVDYYLVYSTYSEAAEVARVRSGYTGSDLDYFLKQIKAAFDKKNASSTEDDSSSSEAANGENPLGNAENQVQETLENPDADLTKDMSDSQKEAWAIMKNKYMSISEYDAFKWNFIVSQFTIPYYNNVQDVLQTTYWKQMKDKNLSVTDNPYLERVKDSLGTLSGEAMASSLQKLMETATRDYNFPKIYDTLMENGEVSYSPLYKSDNNPAYITDMFDNDIIDDQIFYVKDKIALAGESMSSTNLSEAYPKLGEQYLFNSDAKKETVASDIKTSCKVVDIEFPVYIQTDSTLMYNALFVNNALRVGGYATYNDFIQSLGNSQLYVDRWGNICAYCKVNGEFKYVVVYPSYANPLFTSIEMEADDFAGYAYTGNDDTMSGTLNYNDDTVNAWISNVTSNENTAGLTGGSWNVIAMNPNAVAKTYEEAKTFYGPQGDLGITEEDCLGSTEGSGSYGNSLIYYKTSNGDFKNVGGVYNRRTNSFTSSDIIPYIQFDTTNNFLFNKTVLASYTRDSVNALKSITGGSSYASNYYDGSSHNFYDCFSDQQNTYSKFKDAASYNASNTSGLFSNQVVFDKFDTRLIMYGAGLNGSDKKGIILNNCLIANSSLAVGVDKPTYNSSGSYSTYINGGDSLTNSKLLYKGWESINITDTSKAVDVAYTQYPFMLSHAFRKGMLAESPTLQSTRFGNGLAISNLITDYYVAPSMDLCNAVSWSTDAVNGIISEKLAGSSLEFTQYGSQAPELLWNGFALDSDRFKTYVTLNYTSETVPSNSVLYGMNRSIVKKGDVTYSNKYLQDMFTLTSSSRTAGRRYTSIGLLDSTLDFGQDWNVWYTTLEDDDYYVASIQDSIRDRSLESFLNRSNKYYAVDGGLFRPYSVSNSDGVHSLRYILKDQRVSDVLEEYPLDDLTLLSFVWLNYYIPQTPITNKICFIETEDTSGNSLSSLTDPSVTTTAATTSTTTTGEESSSNSETEESIYKIDGKSVYLGKEYLYPEDTLYTIGTVMTGDNVNNTLLWTVSQDASVENTLSLGSKGGVGIGTADSLVVSNSKINRVSVNYGAYILSICKNTSGDNLTHLLGKLEESDEFDASGMMSKIEYFLKHPVVSLCNIILGITQMIHNNIACGSAGNMFNISWIVDTLVSWNTIKWYLIISGIFLGFIVVIRLINYVTSPQKTMSSVIRELSITIISSTIPVLLIYGVNDALSTISRTFLKDASGKIALVETESNVATTEALNVTFEIAYQMYRDQFEGITDMYKDLSIPIPNGWDEYNKELKYSDVNLKDLYDSVSYSTLLTAALTESKLAEMNVDGKEFEDYYTNCSPAVSYLYYNYDNFVPVNYKNYDVSIFYYFYDYVKYQYLKYWASISGAEESVFTAAAKNYSLPDYEKEELWSSYAQRMWDAERYMLLKSYNGIYKMYNDPSYVYVTDQNSSGVYSLSDMFGLSYLFNMTSPYNNQYMGSISSEYVRARKSAGTMSEWSEIVRSNFEDKLGNYGLYVTELSKGASTLSPTSAEAQYSTRVAHNFYPIAYIANSYEWQAMKSFSNAIIDSPHSDSLDDYKFSPTYLTSTYPEWYEMYDLGTLDAIRTGDDAIGYSRESCFAYQNFKERRLFGRVYASPGMLKNHLGSNKVQVTDLEKKLIRVNNNIYDAIESQINYLQGDIRDATLIFNIALTCTYEFNKEFSGSGFKGSQISPQHLNDETLDLDKFMRATFAPNIDAVVKNRNVMYMIYESNGGFLTSQIVALSELAIGVTVIIRGVLLIAMLLICAYICLSYSFHPPKRVAQMWIGLLSQLAVIILTQFIILWTTTVLMNLVSKLGAFGLLVALTMLSLYVVIAIISIKMLFILSKDVKNFGGQIIADSIAAKTARLSYSIFNSGMNAIKSKSTSIQNVVLSATDKIKTKTKTEREESRRKRNIKRLEDASKMFRKNKDTGEYKENTNPNTDINKELKEKQRRKRNITITRNRTNNPNTRK